ncbi:hypothetical protein ACKWTF_005056 [Chironomus riparius]
MIVYSIDQFVIFKMLFLDIPKCTFHAIKNAHTLKENKMREKCCQTIDFKRNANGSCVPLCVHLNINYVQRNQSKKIIYVLILSYSYMHQPLCFSTNNSIIHLWSEIA